MALAKEIYSEPGVGGILLEQTNPDEPATDAMITKAYAPILVLGAIVGTAIGWIVERFGR